MKTQGTLLDKPGKPIDTDNQRGIGVVELLVAVATIAAAVVGAALAGPKLPPAVGD